MYYKNAFFFFRFAVVLVIVVYICSVEMKTINIFFFCTTFILFVFLY